MRIYKEATHAVVVLLKWSIIVTVSNPTVRLDLLYNLSFIRSVFQEPRSCLPFVDLSTQRPVLFTEKQNPSCVGVKFFISFVNFAKPQQRISFLSLKLSALGGAIFQKPRFTRERKAINIKKIHALYTRIITCFNKSKQTNTAQLNSLKRYCEVIYF